ncbi:hypothetical protein, partial [Helicobacter zhangjianzhongii]|uniref:hypothetical protein n=1 Tax=Helicobacter zhangjianzhongii TaxID=2974574 RepID=UPI0025540CB4
KTKTQQTPPPPPGRGGGAPPNLLDSSPNPHTATKLTFSISLALAGVLCPLAAQESYQAQQTAQLKYTYNSYQGSYNFRNGGTWIDIDDNRKTTVTYITGTNRNPAADIRLMNNLRASDVVYSVIDAGNNNQRWMKLMTSRGPWTGTNSSIQSLTLERDTKFEIKNLDQSARITTINQNAEALHIRNSVNIDTLNQNSTGETKIYGDRVRVTNFNLNDGTLELNNGSITTLNQNAGSTIQQNGTIQNLNLSGGTFTHKGGTLSNVV